MRMSSEHSMKEGWPKAPKAGSRRASGGVWGGWHEKIGREAKRGYGVGTQGKPERQGALGAPSKKPPPQGGGFFEGVQHRGLHGFLAVEVQVELVDAVAHALDELLGDGGAGERGGDVLALKPHRLGQLALLQRDGGVAVEFGEKANHDRVWEGPGLALVVGHVFHAQPHFLKHLPAHGLFKGLADFHKARNQPVALIGAARGARHEQAFPVGDGHNDGRGNFGVFHHAAVAHQGALKVAVFHGGAAAPAKSVVALPSVDVGGGVAGKGQVLHEGGVERGDRLKEAARRRLLGRKRPAHQEKTHFVDGEEVFAVEHELFADVGKQRDGARFTGEQDVVCAKAQGIIAGSGSFLRKGVVKDKRRNVVKHGGQLLWGRGLALLSEIGKAKACRRLVFALSAEADENQHQNGDDIGKHFENFLARARHGDGDAHQPEQVCKVEIQPVEHPEEVGAPDGVNRLPARKDDQRHRQPAQRLQAAAACPGALDVVHGVIQAAQPRNGAANADGQVLAACDVDAGGVGRGGIFTHSAQVEAGARAAEEVPQGDGDEDGQVDQPAQRVEDGRFPQAGQHGAEGGRGDGQGNLAHAAGQRVEAAAVEIGDAAAEDGQRQSGDVLVCPQRDGQKAVNQPAEERKPQRAQQGHKQAYGGVWLFHPGLVKEGANQPADGAQRHDAGHAQVEVAALFGQNFTHGAVENDGAKPDGGLEKRNYLLHDGFFSFLLRRMMR